MAKKFAFHLNVHKQVGHFYMTLMPHFESPAKYYVFNWSTILRIVVLLLTYRSSICLLIYHWKFFETSNLFYHRHQYLIQLLFHSTLKNIAIKLLFEKRRSRKFQNLWLLKWKFFGVASISSIQGIKKGVKCILLH